MSNGTVPCKQSDSLPRPGRAALMRGDCALPTDIVPRGKGVERPRVFLLTGATGFLGRYVLRELLAQPDAEVLCLIRAEDDVTAERRLSHALDKVGGMDRAVRARARALRGDMTEPDLGLTAGVYDGIARRVDAIYHCAAEVNWVRSYKQLRRMNVGGTIELLRFACRRRPKRFLFVSTLAVCFAPRGPEAVDEQLDMSRWLDRMPLGYAQSKCVAETLLRSAAERGLPVTIVRPGLLCGDTVTGTGNRGDLISALIEGCVKCGEAIDADWLFDSVPVDYAAQAIVALGRGSTGGLDIYHLRHGRPRHWRELILWLNLLGYPVRFAPTESWIARMFGNRADGAGCLYGYRRFFAGLPGAEAGDRPFEAFLAPAQATVSCEASSRTLMELGMAEPVINGDLLRRYLDHYEKTGVVPRRARSGRRSAGRPDARLREAVRKSLQLQHADSGLRLVEWEELPFSDGGGILNDIASIRLGNGVGMRRYRVAFASPGARGASEIELVVKDKAEDRVMHQLVAQTAALCDADLGQQCSRFEAALGLCRSHVRELALYRYPHPWIEQHMPRCYGVSENASRGVWSIAIEYLKDAELVGAAEASGQWTPAHIDAAIRGAASIHSVWYGREDGLRAKHWVAPEITPADAVAMTSLWRALASFSDAFYGTWSGGVLLPLQRQFIRTIGGWWQELAALPGTLIHNDYNPRNLAFRRGAGDCRVCVFDWELARVGAPQHDLAELLCFVLPQGAGAEDLARWQDLHRLELSSRAGVAINGTAWRRGFVLALQHLAIDRLPFYALAHRFKPREYLPQVVRNWLRLHELSLELASTDAWPASGVAKAA